MLFDLQLNFLVSLRNGARQDDQTEDSKDDVSCLSGTTQLLRRAYSISARAPTPPTVATRASPAVKAEILAVNQHLLFFALFVTLSFFLQKLSLFLAPPVPHSSNRCAQVRTRPWRALAHCSPPHNCPVSSATALGRSLALVQQFGKC